MKFQEPDPRGKRRPPPNYLSRRVQGRLFLLVMALMLVLVLIERARHPKYYQWLFPSPQTNREKEPSSSGDREESEATVAGGTTHLARDIPPPVEPPPPLERARRDAWQYALEQLDTAAFNALSDALLLQQRGQAVEDEERQASLATAIGVLRSSWQAYLGQARRDLDQNSTGGAPDAQWQNVLQQLEREWSEQALAALQAIAAGRIDVDAADVRPLQAAVEEAALARVVDDSVFQPQDNAAWSRVLFQLQQSMPDSTTPAADVSYAQLLQQPDVYRAKLVRMAGDVREVRHVSARNNAAGVESFYLLWIKPQGFNVPIPVYSLQLPEGFPATGEMTLDGSEVRMKDVPVQVTGYFFKRWSYRAQRGMEVVPLLMVHSPILLDSTTIAEVLPLPNPLILVGVAALLAAACVYFAVRRHRSDEDHDKRPADAKIPPPAPATNRGGTL